MFMNNFLIPFNVHYIDLGFSTQLVHYLLWKYATKLIILI